MCSRIIAYNKQGGPAAQSLSEEVRGEGTVNTSEAASAGSMAASMMEGATTETDHHRPRKQAQGMLTAALLTMPQGSRSCRVSNILEEEEEEFKS